MEGGWTTQVAAGWSKDRGQQQQQGEASAEKVSAEEDKAKAQHVTSLDKKAAGVAEGSKEERMDALAKKAEEYLKARRAGGSSVAHAQEAAAAAKEREGQKNKERVAKEETKAAVAAAREASKAQREAEVKPLLRILQPAPTISPASPPLP